MAELGPSVWRGSGPAPSRGIRVLGAPLGTPEFIDAFGEAHIAKARQLLDRILELPELQHAWLLTYFCLIPRANHLPRQVPPELVQHTAATFEQLTEHALQQLLGGDMPLPPHVLHQARLPFREGGLGLRHCSALSSAIYWSSWADVLPTLHRRFPVQVANVLAFLNTPALQRAHISTTLSTWVHLHVQQVTSSETPPLRLNLLPPPTAPPPGHCDAPQKSSPLQTVAARQSGMHRPGMVSYVPCLYHQ